MARSPRTREDVPWSQERGEQLRSEARRQFLIAVRLLETDRDEAEQHARRCLALAQQAFHWLDDGPLEGEAHADLHKYGKWTRENVSTGCYLKWTGSEYEETCPVTLAHLRFGFSIGFTGNRICSICDSDISECSHEPGTWYDVRGGSRSDGLCRICDEPDCSSHQEGTTYRVDCIVRVTIGQIHEISLVRRPRQPEARLLAKPVEMEKLKEFFGPQFRIGMPVSCDHCLNECSGFVEMDHGSGDHFEEYIPQGGSSVMDHP